MITAEEADRIAGRWAARFGPDVTPLVKEFDLGWVVTPSSEAAPRPVGEGRGIIDRRTGEVSVWPSLAVEDVVAMFREQYVDPLPPRSWDPLRRSRHELRRATYPGRVSHLTVAGRVWSASTAKGDGEPAHHPIVASFYRSMPAQFRERGCERASEALVLSDALLVEDDARAQAGRPPLTLSEARDEFLRGADVVTHRVREPGDASDGLPCRPPMPSMLLLQLLGFSLSGRETAPTRPEGGSA